MTSQEPQRPPGRAGAMTAAMRAVERSGAAKALRVGIIHGGKILHDRVLSGPSVVTFGSAERNTFVVGGAAVPTSFVLLDVADSGFRLRFDAKMQGQLSTEGSVVELAQLIASGRLTASDGVYSVELREHARGKLTFGDVVVLFEWVAAPPRPSQPQLPTSVKQSFAKSVDWLFTAFVLTSFLAHFGFVVYMENADWPLADNTAEQLRIGRLLLPELPPPEPPEPMIAPPSVDSDPVSTPRPRMPQPARGETSREAKIPQSKGAEHKPSGDAPALRDEAVRNAENLLLGAIGPGAGLFDDVLKGGAVTTQAEDLFAAVNGSSIARNGQAGLIDTRNVGEGKRTEGLGSLGPSSAQTGPMQAGEPLHESDVRGRIETGDAQDEGGAGEIDADAVTREIKKRLGAIRSCYEQALRRDASLGGKLTVKFRVEQSGTFSHVAIDEDTLRDPGLAQCVTRSLSAARLRTGPEGGSVDFSYPFVFKSDGSR